MKAVLWLRAGGAIAKSAPFQPYSARTLALSVSLLVLGLISLSYWFARPERGAVADSSATFNSSQRQASGEPGLLSGEVPRQSTPQGHRGAIEALSPFQTKTRSSRDQALPSDSRSRQIIEDLLWMLDQPHSVESSGQFLRQLAELANEGEVAAPLIRDLLLSGVDRTWPADSGFRHRSLRLALIDTLQRIGGEQAHLISAEFLMTPVSAREFVALAGYLQHEDPGFYRSEIQQAGRNLIDQDGDLDPADLGPVYQLLGEAGATSAADLARAPPHLQQYASVALALLPGGEGVPVLIDKLRQSAPDYVSQADRLDLQLLAQSAFGQPGAAALLTDLAGRNLIPDTLWPEIAALAAGLERIQLDDPGAQGVSRLQVASPFGSQVVYRSRAWGPRDATEALARLELIERLYEAAPPGNAARQALASVLNRMPSY